MKVFSTSLLGKRPTNEDTHNIILNGNGCYKNMNTINYFSVYDGHGGSEVSHFLEKYLYHYFLAQDTSYPLSKTYVNNIYNYIQSYLKKKHKEFSIPCGSTSLVMCHFRKCGQQYINVINIGDSRAVLCRGEKAEELTIDHKPNNPEEKKRIKKLGGKVYYDGYDWRVGDLSVSRSFGDIDTTPYVTHKPDLYYYKIKENDKFIVMACDGLWDVVSSQEVINVVLQNFFRNGKLKSNSKNIADFLGRYAIEKGSTDNVTIIVVVL